MTKTHIVRTVVTITTEEPFLNIYNAKRRAFDVESFKKDFTKIDNGVSTRQKTKVEIIPMQIKGKPDKTPQEKTEDNNA